MSTKSQNAREWLESGLERFNDRARVINDSTEDFRVALDVLNDNSARALKNAIMIEQGLGMRDVADSLTHLAAVLPKGSFAPDLTGPEAPPPDESEEGDIIDAEFEVTSG